MTTSVEIRTKLVDILRRDLVGPSPHDNDLARERLSMEPSRWYLTGFIAPGIDAPEGDVADTNDELGASVEDDDGDANRVDKTTNGGAAPDREPDDYPVRRKSWRPTAIGLTVLVPMGVNEVTAVVTWGDYQTEPPIERFLLEAHEESGKPDKREAPSVEWVRTPRSESVALPIPNGRAEKSVVVPNSATPQLPGGALELVAHARPYTITMPDRSLSSFQALTVFLVNKRKRPRRRYEDVAFAFQAQLELACEAGFVARADLSGYGTDDWDRSVADLHYADCHEYGVGRNTSAVWDDPIGGKCIHVATCPLPTSKIERVASKEAHELRGIEFGMEALARLSELSGPDLAAGLAPLVTRYQSWIDNDQAQFSDQAKGRQVTAKRLVDNMHAASARIASGIELLRTDEQARLAFRVTNDAMALSQRKRSPERHPPGDATKAPKWRPFQLAFILLNLAGLIEKTHQDRDIVDLLFFPTGGGKTEAYLGLAAFTIAHRRITHPGLSGAGVAVIMRYTLRLLTLDQLGRASGVICALELARLDAKNVDANGGKLLGDWPIEIGLWVGSAASPNRMGGTNDTGDETAVTRVRQHQRDAKKNAAPAPIKACPWCGTEFKPTSFSCVPNAERPTNLEIRCVNGDCEFSELRALPILVVDEPIYRRLPAFIVATIDKFAALPWVGETGAFFDHVDRYDSKGFLGAATAGGTKLPGGAKLLPPDLIIQDELHLISGPLGTIAGLYEVAIDRLATRIIGDHRVRPKIVASTATVRRAGTQIKALFDRDRTEIFPPPGLTRRDSFFAVNDSSSPARLYLGIAAQGKGPKLIFLRVLQTMMAAAEAEYESLPPDQRGAADPYMTALCYFNALKELGGALRIVTDEVASGLQTYGTQRRRVSPLDQPFQNRAIREPLELTSRRSTDEVAEAKKRLELPFGPVGPVVDIALATNMISVGLDITRLGLMVVQGQPKTAAEYIQATSRVGRDHTRPGLVITVLNLMKPRDRTHFEHFTQFHQTFYRAVEATSVTPWATRALDRSLAALVVSLARHLDLTLTPESGASKIEWRVATVDAMTRAIVDRAPQDMAGGHQALRNAITELVTSWEAIARSLQTDKFTYGEEFDKRLLITPLDPRNATLNTDRGRFEAARSMRDVEPNVVLKIRDPYGNSVKD